MDTPQDAQRVIEKIRKLLDLAKSTNSIGDIHMAAAAAGKAQELIERYNIEAAMLFDEKPDKAAPIVQRVIYQRPPGKGRVPTWILRLAGGIADANRIYYWYNASDRIKSGTITAAGTTDNLDKATILLNWLKEEVDRLYLEEKPDNLARGHGKRWSNSFRLGAVETINKRMMQAVKEVQQAMRQLPTADDYQKALSAGDHQKVLQLDSQKYSLARVDAALVRLEEDYERTVEWVEETQKLRKGSIRRSSRDTAAFNAGVAAGQRASINPQCIAGPSK